MEEAPAVTASAEAPITKSETSTRIDKNTSKKESSLGGSQIEQRFQLIGENRELRVKTPHSEYIHCGDNKDVRIQIETVREIANYATKRLSHLRGLKNLENTTRTEVETLLLAYGDKWVEWGNFLEGRADAKDLPEIEQADLDLAYYLLEDEIFQKGTLLGYESILHGPGLLMSGLGSLYRGQWEAQIRQHSPAFRDNLTDYQRYTYESTQDPAKITEMLTGLEKTRIELLQGLTGKGPHDPAWRRANWGLCLDSIGRRDNSEIKLHTQILQHLEGNKDFRAVLTRYQRDHPHVRTITDLLINVSNAQDRDLIIRAYQEAMNVAVASRLKERAHDFTERWLLKGDRQKAWTELGLVEKADQNRKVLEKERDLSEKDKARLTQVETDLGKVRKFLSGVEGDEITASSDGGLAGKITTLQSAISACKEYHDRPENITSELETQLGDAQSRHKALVEGNFIFASLPTHIKDDIKLSQDLIDGIKKRLDAARLGTVMPVVASGAPLPAPSYTFHSIEDQNRQTKSIEDELRSAQTKLNTLVSGYEQAEQARIDKLNGDIKAIRNAVKPLEEAVNNAYKFIETELPTTIAGINDMLARLQELHDDPPEQLSPEHIDELQEQINHLTTLRNDYLTAEIINQLRKTPGETTQGYAGRIFAYVHDSALYQENLQNLAGHIRAYDEMEILEAKKEADDRVPAIKLVAYLAAGKDGTDPQHALLVKAYSRILAEGKAGELKILEALHDRHDLDELRDVLCNHPEILADEDRRDSDLWRRVFSDVFILQAGVEFYSQKGDLDIPPAGTAVNLRDADDEFRMRLIERMASSHIELAEFLTFLVEKRLGDAAHMLSVQTDVYEEQPPAFPGGAMSYGAVSRLGPAAKIFSIEENDQFMDRIRAAKHMHYRHVTEELDVENVGFVRYIRPNLDGNIEGDLARLETHESDPVILEMSGRRREFSAYITLGHGIPSSIFGRSGFRLHIRANPSLNGLGIDQFNGRFNDRWVDFDWHRYRNHDEFTAALNSLVPGLTHADSGVFVSGIDRFVLKSLGNWFLSTARDNRIQYRDFPDIEIPGTVGITDNLFAAGYRRLSLDRTSGELVLTREDGERISARTALRRDAENPLNTDGVDQLFRFVGRQVFDILGRR